MAEKTFMFVGGAGTQLTGHLEPPEGTPRGWAIFAHCFTCGKDSRAAVHVSRALSRSGIGVLRFDFAGTGISGGMGGEVSFASDVQDVASETMDGQRSYQYLVVERGGVQLDDVVMRLARQ